MKKQNHYLIKVNKFLREQGKTNKMILSKLEIVRILKNEYVFEINLSKSDWEKDFKKFMEKIAKNKTPLFPLISKIKKSKPRQKVKQAIKNLPNEAGIAFYESKKWQALKQKIFSIYELRCMQCSAEKTELHIDHIKPRSKYPELELILDNLQILCRRCNLEKSNNNEIDYRPYATLKKNNNSRRQRCQDVLNVKDV